MDDYNQDFYSAQSDQYDTQDLQHNPFAAMLPPGFGDADLDPYASNGDGARYPSEQGYYGQGPIVHEGFIPAMQAVQYQDHDHFSTTAPWDIGHDDDMLDTDDDMMMNDELVLNAEIGDAPEAIADGDFDEFDDDADPEDLSDKSADSDFELDEVPRVRGRGKGRGRGRGRASKSTRGRGRGRGRGRSRAVLDDGEGRPRGAPRGRKRGPREAKDPGPEFKNTLARATNAWINEDLEAAMRHAGDAIKINPEVFASYNLLSEILYARGQYEESVHVLSMGAVLQRDVNLWHKIASRVLDLDGDERARLEWAHRCYSQIIRIDPNDWEARCRRLDFQLRFDHKGQAKSELEMMLKIEGHEYDLDRIQQLAELCAVTQETERAVEPFEKALEHHMQFERDEYSQLDWQILNSYLELMQTLKKYEGAIPRLRSGARWILGRQEETFWDDQFDDREWDLADEPRRMEVPHFVPGKHDKTAYGAGLPLEIRVKLGMFRLAMGPDHLSEAIAHFEQLEPEDESETAPVFDFDDLFREVADALTMSGSHSQALRYYNALRRVPEVPQTALLISIAACHWALKDEVEAERSIEAALEVAGSDMSARIQVARFFQDWGMIQRCNDIAQDVVAKGGVDIVRKAKLNVQIPVQRHTQPKDITKRPTPLKPSRPSRPTVLRELAPKPTTLQSLESKRPSTKPREAREPKEFREPKPRRRLRGLLDAEREKLEGAQQRDRAIREMYQELKSIEDAVDEGDEEAAAIYMENAGEMVDEFRRMEAFYPRRDKHVKFVGYIGRKGSQFRMKESALAYLATVSNREGASEGDPGSNLEGAEQAPEDFHDIAFEEWLDIFCRYALLLAKHSKNSRCWTVIQSAAHANIFHHDSQREHHIYVCWLACALILRDEEHLCNACRYLIKQHPYSNDAYRLFGILNRLYPGHRSWYNGGPSQKFVLRLIKAMDFAILDKKARLLYKFGDQERSGYTRGGQSDGNPEGIKDINVALLAMYGHVLASGGAYLNALNYYFRAYSIVPNDAMLNFAIAIAYMQHAMKRQSENRQYQIQQGLTFLHRYYELRAKTEMALQLQEAEFNVARVWHMLGLFHLALPAYERVLALRERVRVEHAENGLEKIGGGEDFAADAAFAVQMIMSLTEDFQGARNVTNDWLVI
ncbi:Tetratricopeptide-like helical [Macrophomina phaseolina MS6]|uniref:Tetratricopeptide-like helical n=1 Tax=Macrophomina phaseolina (strain MS6) TaxID=1126212 RepID=K2R8H5_MACPH|nr:Tetratricopeptide-like helical [Macrophomina phaseolina MS6]